MLTPKELEEIVETLYPYIDQLKSWIVRDMIRRLMLRLQRGDGFLLTGSDEWQARVFQEAGGHYEDLLKQLAVWTVSTEAEIQRIFQDAGIKSWKADDAFYTSHGYPSQDLKSVGSRHMVRILEDAYTRTSNEFRNFTRTTADESQKNFIRILDEAHFKVMSGAQSYTAAVRDAVDEMANTQTTVSYPSGHIDTIEVATLRAVRAGVAQGTGNMSLQAMEDRGWDLIRVSAHLGARYGDGGENPGNHFWWQGKLYSRSGTSTEYPSFEKTTGYGTGEGLCGWNCRHSFGPGDPEFNPYETFDAAENKRVYDMSQRQRSLERKIRKSKIRLLGLQTALENAPDEKTKAKLQETYTKTAQKLYNQNAAYKQFCEENGVKPLADRLRIANWNRSTAAKASAAVRNAPKQRKKDIDTSDYHVILEQRIANGVYSLKLKRGQYLKHVQGTREYESYKTSRLASGRSEQSRLFISEKETQDLIMKLHGTGEVRLRKDGTVANVEYVDAGRIIGEYLNTKGEWIQTQRLCILYGKKGSHVYAAEDLTDG